MQSSEPASSESGETGNGSTTTHFPTTAAPASGESQIPDSESAESSEASPESNEPATQSPTSAAPSGQESGEETVDGQVAEGASSESPSGSQAEVEPSAPTGTGPAVDVGEEESSPEPADNAANVDVAPMEETSDQPPVDSGSLVVSAEQTTGAATAGNVQGTTVAPALTSSSSEMTDEEGDGDTPEISPSACLFDGKVYVSAQQIPRDDHCDFCFCFRGDIICLQQSCPPPIPGCIEEGINGFCCPRYECPVRQVTQNVSFLHAVDPFYAAFPALALPPNIPHGIPHAIPHGYGLEAKEVSGCEIDSQFYQPGEIVPSASGPCLECRCGIGGMMECDPRDCQPEPTLRKVMALVAARRRRHIADDGTIWLTPRRS